MVGGLRVAEHQKRWHRTLDRLTVAAGGRLGLRLAAGWSGSAARSWACDPTRLTVIPNGVDPAPFDQAAPLPRAAIGVPAGADLAL